MKNELGRSNDQDLFAVMMEQSDTNIDASDEPAQQHFDEPRHDSPVQPVPKDSKGCQAKCLSIHDVPYDGNCFFGSVAYQLESIAACTFNASTLRQMVAEHLENNSNVYKAFLSEPVASHDPHNVDTEPPTAQDAYTDSIVDHELQMELRWTQYRQRLLV